MTVGRVCGWRCYICGDGPDTADPWEVEHVRAHTHGGATSLSNLKLAHRSCNRIKGGDSWIA